MIAAEPRPTSDNLLVEPTHQFRIGQDLDQTVARSMLSSYYGAPTSLP